jgi:hypothetical protein
MKLFRPFLIGCLALASVAISSVLALPVMAGVALTGPHDPVTAFVVAEFMRSISFALAILLVGLLVVYAVLQATRPTPVERVLVTASPCAADFHAVPCGHPYRPPSG